MGGTGGLLTSHRLKEPHVSITLSLDEVYALALRALTGSQTSDTNARPVADSIRAAEADGFRHGGLGHLPQYCADARRGRVDGHASPTWEQTAHATICVDAHHGFAHAAFAVARQPLVELTRYTGIAAMGLRHSYDAAVLGYFVEQLARNGLVALAFANSLSRSIAPWGGKTPLFGTNPMAFAVPRPSGDPMVIDQSSSVVARVTVRQHAAENKPLPPGWAFDKDGQPTTDARAGLAGSMAPFGHYKGAALALIVEILAAGVTGASFTLQASSAANNPSAPPNLGQLLITMDPLAFGGTDFEARLETLFAAMLTQEGVRLPGDRRLAKRLEARHAGVAISDDLHQRLLDYCG
jgi:(2R)-3-sulfolactate dehydrogenase (NADP+)